MSEYRHTVSKTGLTGFSADPPQDVSNAGNTLQDTPLTLGNAVIIATAARSGKQIASAGYQAIVGQLGNSKVEKQIEIASKLAGYTGLAIASGAAAPIVVGGAILVEISTSAIQNSVEVHNINLANERLQLTRGGLRKTRGGYYD